MKRERVQVCPFPLSFMTIHHTYSFFIIKGNQNNSCVFIVRNNIFSL